MSKAQVRRLTELARRQRRLGGGPKTRIAVWLASLTDEELDAFIATEMEGLTAEERIAVEAEARANMPHRVRAVLDAEPQRAKFEERRAELLRGSEPSRPV